MNKSSEAFKKKKDPQDDWLVFPSIKKKLTSGMFWFMNHSIPWHSSQIFVDEIIITVKLCVTSSQCQWKRSLQHDQPSRGGWRGSGQKEAAKSKNKIWWLCCWFVSQWINMKMYYKQTISITGVERAWLTETSIQHGCWMTWALFLMPPTHPGWVILSTSLQR